MSNIENLLHVFGPTEAGLDILGFSRLGFALIFIEK
jgi:hypothetical protein